MERKASSAEITRARQALSMAMQRTETAEQAAKEFRGERREHGEHGERTHENIENMYKHCFLKL